VTDGTWRSRKSPVAGSNWYGGEDYDARNEIDGLLEKGYDVGGWDSVKVYEESELYFCAPAVSADKLGIGEMRAKEYDPLRVTETWKAVSVKKNSAGNYLVDFGQNFAGTYEFSLSAPAGTTITIYDSELQANDACMFEYMYQPSGASNQTLDRYTFKGKGTETWGPKFMYHGFRYLEISGLTEQPSPECFTAKRIRSNMDQVGFFETSKSLLNDIHTICRNGIQSQLYNTVTDCPHREKLGWLDVPNMMFSSLSYNYDVKQLLNKVVMDAFDSQGQNGYVPSTVPHFMRAYDDDLNWGGAGITIPYRNYKFYGDKELMTRYYSKMKMLIDYYGTLADNNIIRNYSVLSDWGQNTCGLANYTSSEFTLTCSYYYYLGMMAEMAEVLGHDSDARVWRAKAADVKAAFNGKFFKEGVYEYGNQANYGMALYYGLVDEENVPGVAYTLSEAVKASGYSVKTGEIGLRPTLMSLAANGYNDVVYNMAKKTTYPSYGYWVEKGATTSPEYWDMSLSQNHCMMDHIEEWFFSQLGGISNTGEAYETFSIAPWIPVDMKKLDVEYDSPRGVIKVSYLRTSENTEYGLTVPAGSKASVSLPVVKGFVLRENGKELAEIPTVSDVVYNDTIVTFILAPGCYSFTMDASTLQEDNKDDDDSDMKDVTDDYILNPGFELKDTSTIPWSPTSWNIVFPDGNGYGTGLTFDQRNVNPTEGAFDWHVWYSANNYVSVRMFQTINLDAGSYVLNADMRCVDNMAVTGSQRLFLTKGKEVVDEGTLFSMPYNHDGSVDINISDNENMSNWRTLNLTFDVDADDMPVTIGFDCPATDVPSLGGFQVDNVKLYLDTAESNGVIEHRSFESKKVADSFWEESYYSLKGIKVNAPQNGNIYIHNGKKILF
jgi:alpha-L-rhamnosidase